MNFCSSRCLEEGKVDANPLMHIGCLVLPFYGPPDPLRNKGT